MLTDAVPSDCVGTAMSGTNYCVKAPVYIDTGNDGGSNFQQCEGNCEQDSDCKCTFTYATLLHFYKRLMPF